MRQLLCIIASMIIALTSGCQNRPTLVIDEELTILAINGKDARVSWVEPFLLKNPSVKVNVMQLDEFSEDNEDVIVRIGEIIKNNNIDVIFLTGYEVPYLVSEGLLQNLDNRISNSEMNAYSTNVITSLKNMGQGSIYALSPFFNSYALAYNKDIFTQSGVNPPEQDTSWSEIFNIGKKLLKITRSLSMDYNCQLLIPTKLLGCLAT